ncbi:MAG: serine/threonine protein kinase [Spirochaetales bacterium]|nr:serine/threonine protein kinase [Spirochaetales bacterium]
MDRNHFFYDLTPFVVMEAVENAGLKPDGSSLQLNSMENRVYDLGLEDGSHVVAKFYRPGRWTREQIEEEHRFLALLDREEIPVCSPREFPGGGTINEAEGIYYALWPRTGGRQVDEFNEEQLKMLGRYLGRIHLAGEQIPFRHRPRLNLKRMVEEPIAIVETTEAENSLKERFARLARQTGERYEELSRGIEQISLHGDCHTGNLLNDENRFFFLDFDDALTGPAVQDIWMLLGGDDYAQRLELLLEGYETFRPFDRRELKLIEPLRALRMIYYVGWVAKRHEDPAFRHSFPHWGTRDYWEQEIADLEKQTGRCAEETGAATYFPGETKPVEELTNEDYFFDWED